MNGASWNGNEASAEMSAELIADDLNMTDGDDRSAVACMSPVGQRRPIDCRRIIGRIGDETIADVGPGSNEDDDFLRYLMDWVRKSSVQTTTGN